MTGNYKILSGKNLIESLRYGGYKNAAHAVAEIIDNSLDAKATQVELLCLSEYSRDTNRHTISKIAVLDNGRGMDETALRRSLRFGDGTTSGTGRMGRFGVGLPASSLSQCRRVDAYSWTDSVNDALTTCLDLDLINEGQDEVPAPIQQPLPDEWIKASNHLSKTSGTLIVWSKLDKCAWKRANTIFKHSELLLGRLYRKRIANGVQIRMAAYNSMDGNINVDNDDASKERYVKSNDPLYLTAPSSTPGVWGNKQMFQQDGEIWEDKIPINANGTTYDVTVRYSIVKPEVREKDQSGMSPHGQHAGENIGISIIRADRELDLDKNLLSGYETTDRWWGVEVDFQPELDDFFGVTNNKQGATNFSDIAKNIRDVIGNKGEQERIKHMKEEGDTMKAEMAELIVKIWPRIRNMRLQNKQKAVGVRTQRYDTDTAKVEDDVVKRRKEEGHTGYSDKTETEPEQKRERDIRQDLIDAGNDPEKAGKKAHGIVESKEKFVWTKTSLSGTQFFDITPKSGIIHIKLNTEHAAYKNLVEVLDEVPADIGIEPARERLNRARTGLKLLLASWGRFEDETIDDKKRKQIADLRYGWGSVMESFLEPNVD